jgi:hypothetical protein
MITLSNLAKNTQVDAITALVDAAIAPGRFLFYTTGFATLLASTSCAKPAFDPADSGSALLASPTTTALAIAVGTAAVFRLVDGNGVVVLEGTVGVTGSDEDLTFESVEWEIGEPVSVSQYTISAG